MHPYKILIVDDEAALRTALGTYLVLEGYDVSAQSCAEAALELDLACFDLILLDIMMDGMSGVEFAQILKSRPATASIPIIFLTAKDSDDDMVAGLNLGADDYISKPYSIRNVLARMSAVLRRTAPATPKPVECNRTTLVCTVDGNPVKLPKKEFEMLALFLDHPGRIFSRDELLDRLWPDRGATLDRSVDVHITRLRGKIAPYGSNIVTRSGYGYGWQD